MVVYQGELVVAGHFAEIGGTPANSIARWDGTGWKPLGPGLSIDVGTGVETGTVYDLEIFHDALIACGTIGCAGELRFGGVARWDGNSWSAMGNAGFGYATALAVCNDELAIGCYGYEIEGVRSYGVALWDGTRWRRGLEDDSQWVVLGLFADGSDLIASGINLSFEGTPLQTLARFDGTQWHEMDSGFGGGWPNSYAVAFARYQGTLIAAGAFDSVNGTWVGKIVQWDGTRWSPLGSGIASPDLFVEVRALLEHNGELVVGGCFARVGNLSVSAIARWDGTAWSSFDSGGSGLDGFVADFEPYQGSLIACGTFQQAGPTMARGVAQWDGNGWVPMDAGLAPDSMNTLALAACGNELYAGFCNFMSEDSHASVNRWDGEKWSRMGEPMNSWVTCLACTAAI